MRSLIQQWVQQPHICDKSISKATLNITFNIIKDFIWKFKKKVKKLLKSKDFSSLKGQIKLKKIVWSCDWQDFLLSSPLIASPFTLKFTAL